MECPKCHRKIEDNTPVCPYCKKVLLLKCPLCGEFNQTAVCEKCGYTILTKCAKCGKTVPLEAEKCFSCGFPTKTSLAYLECDSDDFTAISVKFGGLKSIRKALKSKDLYSKFYFKLKNLFMAQVKGFEGKVILYDSSFVINFNKELSFPTSANKAVKFAIKIANAFSTLNLNVIEELSLPLQMSMTLFKKEAKELQDEYKADNNIKLLNTKKNTQKYLRSMQIILDQFVYDTVYKDYKADSFYSVEKDGQSIMLYELILSDYVLPPNQEDVEDTAPEIKNNKIAKKSPKKDFDIYSFKVFDINAKCNFHKVSGINLFKEWDDNKIIAVRSEKNLAVRTSEIVNYYKSKNFNVIYTLCTEHLNYKPWGFFEQIFREIYNLPFYNGFINQNADYKNFNSLFNLIFEKPVKASTPEDARFRYMEDIGAMLSSLKNTVIIVDGFENMDDTSIQTLELYFDKFKKINLNFVFITDDNLAVHSKIKGLLRTPLYTEYSIQKSSSDSIISQIKEDASDFIQSFYFTKIVDNYDGSMLYYQNAEEYLKEKNILINFDNRLIIKNKASVVLPADLKGLIRARLKHLSKNMDASMILAYSAYLGARIDFQTLEKLDVHDVEKNAQILEQKGFVRVENKTVYINNYGILKNSLSESVKKETEEFLCNNILKNLQEKLDSVTFALILGKLKKFNEEYTTLINISEFSINAGDYDAYLKNCLSFLSLLEHIESNISQEQIDENKKEVYQNILMSLYSYSPSKIYPIENVLLMDAIAQNDNDKIVKLSNLMLQGALITSNYSEASALLHNILSRMQNPMLIVDGSINTRFLLLSLVNIEILFNIGNYNQCIEIAEELLSVLRQDILDKIRPKSFSLNLFVSHLYETFRLAALAKLFTLDSDLEVFFVHIKNALGEDFEDKNSILAIKDFLAGKEITIPDLEECSDFSKVIYIILKELAVSEKDYKVFAQNIYQAKLLSMYSHQKQQEYICDLLIAYAYAKAGVLTKADSIYKDIENKSEKSAIFNVLTAVGYLHASLKISEGNISEAFLILNNTLANLRKHNNQIMYALCQKLLIELAKLQNDGTINIEAEEQKLALIAPSGELAKLLS